MRFLKQSHSAEKLERGDPLGFLKLQFAAKYQKKMKGGLFGDKNFRKFFSKNFSKKNEK